MQNVNQVLSCITGIRFVDMMDVTCSEIDSCNVLTGHDGPVFFDTAHLTREGAAYLAPSLLKMIANQQDWVCGRSQCCNIL